MTRETTPQIAHRQLGCFTAGGSLIGGVIDR